MTEPASPHPETLTPEESAFLRATADFCAREVAPHAAAWEEAEEMPREIFVQAGRAGLLGIMAPRELGGRGYGKTCYAWAIRETARHGGAFAMNVAAHNALCVGHALAAADDALRARIFPRAVNGEWRLAWALTEPNAGSDSGGVETIATARPDGAWELTGHKLYITMGLQSDRMIVIAVSGRTPEGRKEFSAFWVEPKDCTPVRKVKTAGVRASNTAEFTLAGVRGELLGARGTGRSAALACLDVGRLGIAAMSIGLARAAVDTARERMLTREQFGRKLAEFQALQFQLADCEVELRAAEALLAEACRLADRGQPHTIASSVAKLYASEAGTRACHRALQICGGWGYTRDTHVERCWRDARLCEIGEGSSEVQRLIISRSLLQAGGARPADGR